MTKPTASIVIASRGRPAALRRCLLGVSQLQYHPFEVIVVADAAGIAAAQNLTFSDHLKLIDFNEANISAARNLGIQAAAGEVIAFIDDDAVPEPSWLAYLVDPVAMPDVAAMTGFVRGRNGISFQHRASIVGSDGFDQPYEVKGDATVVPPIPESGAIKTQGTNMAFRREVLVQLGGFDEAFRFFLDETDLNMRLAKAGFKTAIAPLAQVHHGFAASSIRRHDRVPTDLFEIAASCAVFHNKHLDPSHHSEILQTTRIGQEKRALGYLVSGGLGPEEVRYLMRRFDDGYAKGTQRTSKLGKLSDKPSEAFMPFPSKAKNSVLISGRPLNRRLLNAKAKDEVKAGNIITVFAFSRTTLYHRHYFTDEGYWVQTGGVFGKSKREMRLFSPYTFSNRVKDERERIAKCRGLDV